MDLDALAHNVAVLRRRVPGSELMAVVKANAYGHGAVAVAAAALEAGATRLGVACVDEAVQLRAAGIEAPILVLGHSPPQEAAALVAHNVTATIDSQALADALSREAQRLVQDDEVLDRLLRAPDPTGRLHPDHAATSCRSAASRSVASGRASARIAVAIASRRALSSNSSRTSAPRRSTSACGSVTAAPRSER